MMSKDVACHEMTYASMINHGVWLYSETWKYELGIAGSIVTLEMPVSQRRPQPFGCFGVLPFFRVQLLQLMVEVKNREPQPRVV